MGVCGCGGADLAVSRGLVDEARAAVGGHVRVGDNAECGSIPAECASDVRAPRLAYTHTHSHTHATLTHHTPQPYTCHTHTRQTPEDLHDR